MHAVDVYFGFHPRTTLSEVRGGKPLWGIFGHVEAMGYTRDDTWFFFDPARINTRLHITHHHDEVQEQIAGVIARSQRVYKTDYRGEVFWPPILPQTCVSQCAALIGVRAYTPRTLERKLQALQAELIHEQTR